MKKPKASSSFQPKIQLILKSFKYASYNLLGNIHFQIINLLYQSMKLSLPYINGMMIDSITTSKNYDNLLYYFTYYLAFTIGKFFITELIYLVLFKLLSGSSDDPKLILIKSFLSKDMQFLERYKTGEIIDRIHETSNVMNSNFLFLFIDIGRQLIQIGIIGWSLIHLSIRLSVVFVIVTFIEITIPKLIPQQRNMRSDLASGKLFRYSNYINELIHNLRLVKSMSTEDLEYNNMKAILDDIKHKPVTNDKGINWLDVVYDEFAKLCAVLVNCTSIIFIFYGGVEVIEGRLTWGDFLIFESYSGQLTSSVAIINSVYNQIDEAFIYWDRFYEVIDYIPEIKENESVANKPIKGDIILDKVRFAYKMNPDKIVIDNLSLSIKAGEFIGIVGESGAGKSTLVNLLLRLYPPIEGVIKIDDVDINTMNLKAYHQNIGYVSQESYLFSSSVENNIAYGLDDYGDNEVKKAAQMANAYDFILTLPKGFKTEIGEKGSFLSCGQKQRLAIARAIIKTKKIIIFDEATSSLDNMNQSEIQKAIEDMRRNKDMTIIVIAHRLDTIIMADRIFVIDKGKIAQCGTHKQLMSGNGIYKSMYEGKKENDVSIV